MRHALLLVITVAACDQGAKKKIVPPGPYIVRYDCFHSDQPFGAASSVRNLSFDLGAKTVTTLTYAYQSPLGADAPSPYGPTVSPLLDPTPAMLEAAVIKVLRGGPYRPEYSASKDRPCELAISAGGVEVFKLAKAALHEQDAATDLVKAFFVF